MTKKLDLNKLAIAVGGTCVESAVDTKLMTPVDEINDLLRKVGLFRLAEVDTALVHCQGITRSGYVCFNVKLVGKINLGRFYVEARLPVLSRFKKKILALSEAFTALSEYEAGMLPSK